MVFMGVYSIWEPATSAPLLSLQKNLTWEEAQLRDTQPGLLLSGAVLLSHCLYHLFRLTLTFCPAI